MRVRRSHDPNVHSQDARGRSAYPRPNLVSPNCVQHSSRKVPEPIPTSSDTCDDAIDDMTTTQLSNYPTIQYLGEVQRIISRLGRERDETGVRVRESERANCGMEEE